MSTIATPPAAPSEEAADEREVGRLFGLSDAVFAIAMTLLALDLRVPDLGASPPDEAVRHALAEQGSRYLSFLLSFYIAAVYWRRYRHETRTVRVGRPALVRCTMLLLLAVSALPFASSLLGAYGGHAGTALAVYAGVNVLATVALLLIRYAALPAGDAGAARAASDRHELWFDLVALALAVPVGYLIPGHGIEALFALLVISGRAGALLTGRRRRRETGPA
ncbi:TMEM175 family protein [Streptomyces sp. NPDC093109]|uniref:TMEM175 family protein n=1 Tax=Streptomyces sp. NPDC093109 TaxID=3154977 RepID=UPI00344EDC47